MEIKTYVSSGKLGYHYIQGLTPKFPRSFVSREQLNKMEVKNDRK